MSGATETAAARETTASGSGDLWQLEQTIFEGPDSSGIQLLDSVGYYTAVADAVQSNFSVLIGGLVSYPSRVVANLGVFPATLCLRLIINADQFVRVSDSVFGGILQSSCKHR